MTLAPGPTRPGAPRGPAGLGGEEANLVLNVFPPKLKFCLPDDLAEEKALSKADNSLIFSSDIFCFFPPLSDSGLVNFVVSGPIFGDKAGSVVDLTFTGSEGVSAFGSLVGAGDGALEAGILGLAYLQIGRAHV